MKQLFTLSILFAYLMVNAQEATFDTPVLLFDHPQADNVLLGKGVVAMDHNQDGILDFAVHGDGQWLYEGGEDMSFTKIDISSITLSKEVFATLDFDNDGDMDIVTKTYVLSNDGGGMFTVLNIGMETFSSDVIVAVADIDGDDDLDFFIKQPVVFEGDGLKVHINDGMGGFTEMSLPVLDNTDFEAVDVGDIDGDGDIDLVIAMQFESDEVILYWNDGSGQFTMDVTPIADEIGSTSIELEDMDNDGDLDLLAIGDDEIWVYENVDNFETYPSSKKYVSDVLMFRTADLNSDGLLDVLYLRHENEDLIIGSLENEGALAFTNPKDIHSFVASDWVSFGEPSYLKHSLQAIDMDADGKKDIVYTDGFSEPNSVVYLKGIGNFISSAEDVEIEMVSVAPNPVVDFIQIKDTRLDGKQVSYSIISSTGATLASGTLENQINVSRLKAGFYVIILETETESFRSTFSKI